MKNIIIYFCFIYSNNVKINKKLLPREREIFWWAFWAKKRSQKISKIIIFYKNEHFKTRIYILIL